MPLISVRLVAGRPHEQLARLAEGVTAAASDALDIPAERIGVHILELEPHQIARGGRLVSEIEAGEG